MSLQALGLTASQTGNGTFVISDRVRAPLLIGRYSPAHIKEVRRALEIPSAQFAAVRRTDHDVGQLAALLARMEDADDPAKRNKLDADFHIAIAVASGNALFVKLIEDMRTILEEHSLVARQGAAPPQGRERRAHQHLRRRSCGATWKPPEPRWPSTSTTPSRRLRCSAQRLELGEPCHHSANSASRTRHRDEEDPHRHRRRAGREDGPHAHARASALHLSGRRVRPQFELRSRQGRRSHRDRAEGRRGPNTSTARSST